MNSSVKRRNPTAFVLLPSLVPLENAMNVPPPTKDEVNQQNHNTSGEVVGGF